MQYTALQNYSVAAGRTPVPAQKASAMTAFTAIAGASGELVVPENAGVVIQAKSGINAIRVSGTATSTAGRSGPGTTANQIQFYSNDTIVGAFDQLGLYTGSVYIGSSNQFVISKGAGSLLGNIVIGNSTSGNNLTGSGTRNTIIGSGSGTALTTGAVNTLVGEVAGALMTTGTGNTALGAGVMAIGNVTGSFNTGMGINALNGITTGSENVAVGYLAMGEGITTGFYNTCVGNGTGRRLTSGYLNTLIGLNAGASLNIGAGNVCVGSGAGEPMTTGDNNICIGRFAGKNITTGSQNTCIGFNNQISSAGSSNEIVIGNNITGLGANTIFMKAVGEIYLQSGGSNLGVNMGPSSAPYISSLFDNGAYYIWDYGRRPTAYGNPAIFNIWRPDQASPAGLFINNSQQFAIAYNSANNLGTTWAYINGTGATVWTFPSDARLKNSIVELPTQTEKLMKLRPVNYKRNDQTDDTLKYGFIAQEVKEIYPEFVSIMPKKNDDDEDYYGLGLSDFVPCLVKVAQDQQIKINSLEEQLASLKNTVDSLVKYINK
jgi:hypothetical protein